ncbi:hypothetical protein GOM49_04580 [Clostridium bovifaecis]|uniref:Uncharacterized protein n=1 Tax=Clostridium bovifaecis TaxID=2184719 RepID=A0A6I6EL57_9CLOT|nr:hypothetical protein GOM49_04580 [Clostridium bovifaecis]
MKNKFLSFLTFACITTFALGGKIAFAVPLSGAPIGSPSGAPLITQEVTEINTTQVDTIFKFIPTMTGEYTIKTIGTIDTYGTLYEDISLSILAEDDDEDGTNFVIKYNLIAGNTYYLSIY